MSPRAVIFDMDGVIVDSEPLWREAEIISFAHAGYTLTEEMCRSTAGLRLGEVITHWQRKFGFSDEENLKLYLQVNEKVIQLIKEKGVPFAGLHELVTQLKKKNIRVALASGSSYEIIYTVLDKFNIRNEFQVVRSGSDEEYSKPHPQIFISTAKLLDVLPQDCVVIEDSRNGVIAARAAQMKVIAMPEPEIWDDPVFGIALCKIKQLKEVLQVL